MGPSPSSGKRRTSLAAQGLPQVKQTYPKVRKSKGRSHFPSAVAGQSAVFVRVGVAGAVFITVLFACALLVQADRSAAATSANYGNVVFTDGFESGSLSAWNGYAGTGTGTVVAAAAHTGTSGLRLNNASGQFGLVQKALTNPLVERLPRSSGCASGRARACARSPRRVIRRAARRCGRCCTTGAATRCGSIPSRVRAAPRSSPARTPCPRTRGRRSRCSTRRRPAVAPTLLINGRRRRPGTWTATTRAARTSSACSCGTTPPTRATSTT